MKVTVCELSDNEQDFINDWHQLKIHLDQNESQLLLLPELPFNKWIANEQDPTDAAKIKSIEKHEEWITALKQLNVKHVVYSKPVLSGGKFFNTAFVYDKVSGHRKIHAKSFFPQESHFWEESWYQPEELRTFDVIELPEIKIGVLICTEMWFTQYAREYAKQGIDILLCPRATGIESLSQWIRCGQTLSVISGAFCISSNKSGLGDNNFQWGGGGWIAEPVNGKLAGITDSGEKFVTKDVDINKSRAAKNKYPLYVRDYFTKPPAG